MILPVPPCLVAVSLATGGWLGEAEAENIHVTTCVCVCGGGGLSRVNEKRVRHQMWLQELANRTLNYRTKQSYL